MRQLEALWTSVGVIDPYLQLLHSAVAPQAHVPPSDDVPSLRSLAGLCCAAAGGVPEDAESFTMAWWQLYAALHVLDSVEDGDVVDAPWSQWGPGPAINVSTGLIASVGIALGELERTTTHQAAHAIRDDVFRTLLRMAAGQHADLTLHEPTLEQCWRIAEAKSGIFFALACRSGAQLATAMAETMADFGELGCSSVS